MSWFGVDCRSLRKYNSSTLMATPPPPYPQPCPEFHRFGPTGRSLGLSMGSGEVLPDLPAYAGVWEVVRSYPISLPMLECTWSGPRVVPDHPITRHFQPLGSPHSISLPSPSFSPPGILWSHMGLGSGWRESIHLVPSSPEETQRENPTVRRIHGPTSRLYRYYDTLFMTILYYDHSM